MGSRIGGRLALFGGNVLATVTAKRTDARGGAYGAFGRDCKFEFSVRMAARLDADVESQGPAKRFFEILIRTPDTRGLSRSTVHSVCENLPPSADAIEELHRRDRSVPEVLYREAYLDQYDRIAGERIVGKSPELVAHWTHDNTFCEAHAASLSNLQ